MTDDRFDFRPLDPTADPARFDRVVASIGERAQLELARRRARATAFGQIAAWRRPMLAAAAAIVIASVTILTQVATTTETDAPGLGPSLGVPQALADWALTETTPTPADLFTGLTEEIR